MDVCRDNPRSPPPNTPSDMNRRNFRSGMNSRVGNLEPFENEEEILGDMTIREDKYNEDEEGKELFGDSMKNDYRPMPALDQYDIHNLD